MNIKQMRIDSRLIHGQVATFWTNFLGVNRIIVVSDKIVRDKLQVDMLKMSCPSGCKLTVCQISTLVKNLENDKYDSDNILIIAPDILTAYELYESLNDKQLFPVINLGNVPVRDGTFSIAKTVNVTNEELEQIKSIRANNVNVFLQMIPNSPAISLEEALVNSGKETNGA